MPGLRIEEPRGDIRRGGEHEGAGSKAGVGNLQAGEGDLR